MLVYAAASSSLLVAAGGLIEFDFCIHLKCPHFSDIISHSVSVKALKRLIAK